MLADKKKKKQKKAKEEEIDEVIVPVEENENESDAESLLFDISALAPQETPKIRAMGIYGTINEEKCADALFSLVVLSQTGKKDVQPSEEDEASSQCLPIDFYISTYGGSATDMFAVYDAVRLIKDQCPVRTIGLGKVMSAGVLLLACGTKGERKIGANCRVMIHGVMSGQQGHLHDLENEMEEAKFTQKQYIKALAKETNMTEKYIKNLMDKKINVYLDAEEAVDLGIADIII